MSSPLILAESISDVAALMTRQFVTDRDLADADRIVRRARDMRFAGPDLIDRLRKSAASATRTFVQSFSRNPGRSIADWSRTRGDGADRGTCLSDHERFSHMSNYVSHEMIGISPSAPCQRSVVVVQRTNEYGQTLIATDENGHSTDRCRDPSFGRVRLRWIEGILRCGARRLNLLLHHQTALAGVLQHGCSTGTSLELKVDDMRNGAASDVEK